MKCEKCATRTKVPVKITNIFLPKITEVIKCDNCQIEYKVSNITSWFIYMFYPPILVLLVFIIAIEVNQLLNNFYVSFFIGWIVALFFDYLIANYIPMYIIPSSKTKDPSKNLPPINIKD